MSFHWETRTVIVGWKMVISDFDVSASKAVFNDMKLELTTIITTP